MIIILHGSTFQKKNLNYMHISLYSLGNGGWDGGDSFAALTNVSLP
jgi:hypothetical protein